jgi:hypothetical protein
MAPVRAAAEPPAGSGSLDYDTASSRCVTDSAVSGGTTYRYLSPRCALARGPVDPATR